jgi:hypothetical protein
MKAQKYFGDDAVGDPVPDFQGGGRTGIALCRTTQLRRHQTM